MSYFNYYQPTEILFGQSRVNEIGAVAKRFGGRALLVTVPVFPEIEPVVKKIKSVLSQEKIEIEHFDQVIPNPTVDVVASGSELAARFKAEFVIGLGGGSSIDTAKAIAVETTHNGSCWDYLFFRENQPTEKTLPVIAIPTTSGTGSHVTQVAVVTNPSERKKSALYHPRLYPEVAIVDPELMVTLPPYMTAVTGFDAFSHAFESFIARQCSPYTEILALEGLRLIIKHLPAAVQESNNLEAREKMAWADTLAGLCIANSAVTLPHGIAMAMSGLYPQIAHGQALASIYPAVMKFSHEYAIDKFAKVARLLNPDLASISDREAAAGFSVEIDNFIGKLGIKRSLGEIGVVKTELPLLARVSLELPDYKNHPYVVKAEEVERLLSECY